MTILSAVALLGACGGPPAAVAISVPDGVPRTGAATMREMNPEPAGDEKVVKTDAEWKKILTPEQYRILREKGTERAFTGALWNNHAHGVYRCAACGNPLFSSETKFESGTGWPSFWAPLDPKRSVDLHEDRGWFVTRTEVVCHRCGGHIGHVFDDGPPPTGLRYCMNSGAMTFEPTPAK